MKRISALLSIALLLALLASLDSSQDRTPEKVDYVGMTKILRRHDPGICYASLHEQYRRMDVRKPFSWAFQGIFRPGLEQPDFKIKSPGAFSRILLVANATLYADTEARARILRYAEDIRRACGSTVIVETVEGGTPEDIKAVVQDHYAAGLDGVVLIGRLPAAWFEVPNDHYWWKGGYGYADWTIDLFYMDMDGLWEDRDHNGKYDTHTSGSGDVQPELFVGRIDASTMAAYGNEVELFCAYMDKDHLYWTGQIRLPNYGLVYTDHDWATEDASHFRHLYGATNYEDIRWLDGPQNEVNKTDYLNRRLPDIFYGFVQIWTHATY
ncbi:MAG: C25 family cysteine peptidase, partial [Candidatus Aminicenantes bacterium]|nr:C25 family cysteine peptidase [Candidatus Aminicenantes bacterium]